MEFKEDFRWEELLSYCEKESSKNPDLFALLSCMYLFGKGVAKQPSYALSYVQDGINKNSKYCIGLLGYIYSTGRITAKDPVKSFEYLSMAADKGLAQCMFMVGKLYATGVGVGIAYENAKH